MDANRTIAGVFGLAAFAVAIVAGLAGGNTASSILSRAIMSMIVCYPLGLAVGFVAQRVINDHIERHRVANPVPDVPGDEERNSAEARGNQDDGERAERNVGASETPDSAAA